MKFLSFQKIMAVALLIILYMAGNAQGLKRDSLKIFKLPEANPKLKRLLTSIERESEYRFNYNHENIDPERIIKLTKGAHRFDLILHQIATQSNVSVRIDNYNIVFAKKNSSEAPDIPGQTGLVYDEESRPLAGVSIKVYGTPGSPKISGPDGKFRFSISLKGIALEFIKDGYESKVVKPINDEILYVEMKRAYNQLTEVIVPGNIPTTRKLNTATVNTVPGKDLSAGFEHNIFLTLQGKVPGLIVTEAGGLPGSTPRIQIRGQQSIGSQTGAWNLPANNPLIQLNGIDWPTSNQPMNKIRSALGDPELANQQNGYSLLNSISQPDIEKIEVYKDADATAIFGSKGAHGVISVWTKKGDVGGSLKYGARIMQGTSVSAFKPRMMNTGMFAQMLGDALTDAGAPVDATTAPVIHLWPLNRNTNWVDHTIGKTARIQQFHLSASGGVGKQFSIYSSVNFQHESGVMPEASSNQSGSFHVNANFSPGKKSNTQFSLLLGSSRNRQPAIDPMSLIWLAPNAPALKDAQGRYVFEENGLSFTNIDAQLLNRYEAKGFTIHGSIYSQYQLANRWFFKIRLGFNNMQLDEKGTYPIAAYPASSGMTGSVETASSAYLSLTADPQLQYLDTSRSSKRTISITLGATYQSRNDNWNSFHMSGFTSDNLIGQPEAATDHQRAGDEIPYRYAAMYGAINLTLQEKYIINITGRMDGSSRLGPDHRFAAFGALGTGWIFTNTKWAKDHLSFLSFAKLRASIGTTGNDNVGAASYKDKYKLQADPVPYGGMIAIGPVSLANKSLSWEQNLKKEIAIDLQTEAGISMTFAFYHNITSRQLIAVSLPSYLGYTYLNGVNHSAKVLNSGFELWMEAYRKIGKRIKWSAELSLTMPRNRLKEFANLESSLYNRSLLVGKSLTEQQAFLFSRINPATGLSEFININGDAGISKPEDMVPIGNLDPVVYGGLTNKFAMRQWELSVFAEGRVQNNINPALFGYLRQPGSLDPGLLSNQLALFNDRWRNNGDIARSPKVSVSHDSKVQSSNDQLMSSDKMLKDGSYIRIRYINLSWSAPRHWISRYSLSSVKLFVRAQNIITFTGYTEGDPTITSPLSMPSLRSFLVGFELSIL